jgi:hypothetical protein
MKPFKFNVYATKDHLLKETLRLLLLPKLTASNADEHLGYLRLLEEKEPSEEHKQGLYIMRTMFVPTCVSLPKPCAAGMASIHGAQAVIMATMLKRQGIEPEQGFGIMAKVFNFCSQGVKLAMASCMSAFDEEAFFTMTRQQARGPYYGSEMNEFVIGPFMYTAIAHEIKARWPYLAAVAMDVARIRMMSISVIAGNIDDMTKTFAATIESRVRTYEPPEPDKPYGMVPINEDNMDQIQAMLDAD